MLELIMVLAVSAAAQNVYVNDDVDTMPPTAVMTAKVYKPCIAGNPCGPTGGKKDVA